MRKHTERGEHPNAKLTEMQVRTIRAHPELPVSVFARLYKVSGESIRRARTGETWGWLDAHLERTDVPQNVAPVITERELYASIAKLQAEDELTPEAREILERYSGGKR